MNSEKIGLFIAELRKEKNMTQQELADLLLSTREAVSKWERGKCFPSYQILINISEIFNVSVDELLYGERKNAKNSKEIIKSVGKIYDDRNKKHRKILILYSAILILLLLFLIYYFITNFNSLKVYNIYYSNDSLSISNGILVITNKNIYFNLGNIESDNKINYLHLYYLKNNEKITIDEIDSDALSFIDFKGYEEYIKLNDLKYIIDNLYLEISYDSNKVTNIHLFLNKDYSNNQIFMKKSTEISDASNLPTFNYGWTTLKEKIKRDFNKDNDIYTLKIDNINFVYFNESSLLIIRKKAGDSIKEWNFNLNTYILYYTESINNNNINSFEYENGKITCDLKNCNNEEELISEFFKNLDLLLKDF